MKPVLRVILRVVASFSPPTKEHPSPKLAWLRFLTALAVAIATALLAL